MADLTLRHLDLGEMHTVTGDWLGTHKKDLHAIAEIVPLIAQIEEVHAEVGGAQPVAAGGVERELSAIFTQQREIDARHDHAVRVLYFALSARAEHALMQESPDFDLAGKILSVSRALLPDGLSAVNEAFAVEAGAAARALENAGKDSDIAAVLKQTPIVKGVTAHDVLVSWAELGKELGALEAKKVALQKGLAEKPAAGSRGEIVKARNAWIDVVQTVLKVMAHSKASAKSLGAIRDVVEGVAKKANDRYAAERKRDAKKSAGDVAAGGAATGKA